MKNQTIYYLLNQTMYNQKCTLIWMAFFVYILLFQFIRFCLCARIMCDGTMTRPGYVLTAS